MSCWNRVTAALWDQQNITHLPCAVIVLWANSIDCSYKSLFIFTAKKQILEHIKVCVLPALSSWASGQCPFLSSPSFHPPLLFLSQRVLMLKIIKWYTVKIVVSLYPYYKISFMQIKISLKNQKLFRYLKNYKWKFKGEETHFLDHLYCLSFCSSIIQAD